jgi:hypothetical protein
VALEIVFAIFAKPLPNKPMKLAARFFQRKVTVIVRKASLVKDLQGLAHRLATPQLIGRAVRRRPRVFRWTAATDGSSATAVDCIPPHLLVLGALLAAGCLAATEPADPPLLQTDSLVVELVREGDLLSTSIPYTFTNRTGGPVYLLNCRGGFGVHLEREDVGGWRLAWSPVLLACLSPPIVIDEAEVWVDTLDVVAGLPGPAGTYRIVWGAAYSSYRPDGPPWGRQLRWAERVSNTFQLLSN